MNTAINTTMNTAINTTKQDVIRRMYAELKLDNTFKINNHIQTWTPISMEWRNLLYYGDDKIHTIRFDDKQQIIKMENAHGKSSIFDIFLFALYDKSWRTNLREKDYLVHYGSDHTLSFVKLVLSVNSSSSKHTIVRTHTSVKLMNDKGEVLDKPTLVNKKIVSWVGEFEHLLMTFFLPQNYIDGCSILSMGAADRKRLLIQLFKIETKESIDKWFKTELQKLQGELSKDEQFLASHHDYKPEFLVEYKNQYTTLHLDISNLNNQKQELAKQYQMYQKKYIGNLPEGIMEVLTLWKTKNEEYMRHTRVDYKYIISRLQSQLNAVKYNKINFLFKTNDQVEIPFQYKDFENMFSVEIMIREMELVKQQGVDARLSFWNSIKHSQIPSIRKLHEELHIAYRSQRQATKPDLTAIQRQLTSFQQSQMEMHTLAAWINKYKALVDVINHSSGDGFNVEVNNHIHIQMSHIQDKLREINREIDSKTSKLAALQLHIDKMNKVSTDIDAARLRMGSIQEQLNMTRQVKDEFIIPDSKGLFDKINELMHDWRFDPVTYEIVNPYHKPNKCLSGYEKKRGELLIRNAIAKTMLIPRCEMMFLDEPFDSVSETNMSAIINMLNSFDIKYVILSSR